jgi:hypothetical protein
MIRQLKISPWHIAVAAEAYAAGLFARCGLDVSVQYGADQPEYDLVVVRGDYMLKVSVKGSQDGSWGPIVYGTYWLLQLDNARLLNISRTIGVNKRSR